MNDTEKLARELFIFISSTYGYGERQSHHLFGNWDKAKSNTKWRYRKLAAHVQRMILEARIEIINNISTMYNKYNMSTKDKSVGKVVAFLNELNVYIGKEVDRIAALEAEKNGKAGE